MSLCCVLAGYTVSSVIVGDWKKLYIAGAPRFKHKGKVILFQLTDYGDVTIVQALNGEQVKLSPSLPLPPSLSSFIAHKKKRRAGASFLLKVGTPPTGSKLKQHLSKCRLDPTMAVKCAGWTSTRMASPTSFWSQLQCSSAQGTRRPVESTSTASVG